MLSAKQLIEQFKTPFENFKGNYWEYFGRTWGQDQNPLGLPTLLYLIPIQKN